MLELVAEDDQGDAQSHRPQGDAREFRADFIIDCTGLEADIAEHRLLADLLEHSAPAATRSADWTSSGLSSCGDGERRRRHVRVGGGTLGGYFPGVDTFLGLQIAAQEIADDLARRGFCKQIGPIRSTPQWLQVGSRGKEI